MANRGVNKVILIGNLGADPETRYSASGGAICTVSLATTETWNDKQTGEKQERTEWHRVKFFGKLAEIAGQYLKKGNQVYVEGSIRTDKVQGNDGTTKYFTDIIARNMQMLGGRGDTGGEGGGFRQRAPQQGRASGGAGSGGYGGRASAAPAGGNGQPADPHAGAQPPAPPDAGFEDDDIPF